MTAPALLAAALLMLACRDSTAPETSRPGLRVVGQPSSSDTAGAAPAQALVLEVRGVDGQPSVGASVHLQVERVDPARPLESALNVCLVVAQECPAHVAWRTTTPMLSVRTDGQGRVAVRLRFGSLAGQARLRIAVPTLGYEETLSFTTRPAAAGGVQAVVSDTAVLRGEALQPLARVVDRFGNAHEETVAPASVTGPLALGAGGRVTAQALGRGQIEFRKGEQTATAFVSVVPSGGYAAFDPTTSRIVLASFDGRERRSFPLVEPLGIARAGFDWAPDGRSLVYGGSHNGWSDKILRLDAESGASTLVIASGGGLSYVWWARYAADGSGIYFSAQVGGEWYLYRAGTDGADPQRIGPPREASRTTEWRGDPSADGRTLAYVTATVGGGVVIRVLDLVTGTVTPLDVGGQTPRVSPDGRQIVFVPEVGGPLMLMNVDGSGGRVIPTASAYFAEGSFDWSPDGQWLIAATNLALHLVNPTTGEMIELPGTTRLMWPAWKP